MSNGSSCAIGVMNQVLVCGDGPELLVYEGDGTPAWKEFCDDILVNVGVAPGLVLSVDASGRVVRWQNGRRQAEEFAGGSVSRAAFSTTGEVAMADARQIYVPRSGTYFSVGFEGTTGLAFDSSGGSIGAVSATGQLVILRVADGTVVGQSSLPGGALAICAHGNRWFVASKGAVHVVGPDGTIATSIALQGDIQQVSVSMDGALLACVIGAHTVAVVEMLGRSTLGTVVFKRAVTAIGFGGGCSLAIGLEDGEANVLDLARGSAVRTEAHVGRGRTNWNFNSTVDSAQVRGVLARAKTDGGPVASFVYKIKAKGRNAVVA